MPRRSKLAARASTSLKNVSVVHVPRSKTGRRVKPNVKSGKRQKSKDVAQPVAPKPKFNILYATKLLDLSSFATSHPLLNPETFFMMLSCWEAMPLWESFVNRNSGVMASHRCVDLVHMNKPEVYDQLASFSTRIVRTAIVSDAKGIVMFRTSSIVNRSLLFTNDQFHSARATMFQIGTPPFRWNIGFVVAQVKPPAGSSDLMS